MEPLKEFSKTVLSLENCIIPEERLLATPSARDGVSHDLEVDLRIVGCEYIQSAGLLLRLPQVAMATAQVLFQRFYYAKSFVKYSIQPMAMACIFVAAKIEENCRRLRDVINVFHHLRQRRMGRYPPQQIYNSSTDQLFCLEETSFVPVVPMEYMGEEYFKLKSTVIKYERFLLKELGFCVHVKHPHKLIITYLQILEKEKHTPLAQRAWNFMNDSLRTNVFVRFSPETIACACIYLAVRQMKIPLPLKPAWWTVFDTTSQSIEVIGREILALYERPKKTLGELDREIAVLKAQLVKKQVEIKEVKLKKSPTGGDTARRGSPSALTPVKATANDAAASAPLSPRDVHASSVPPSSSQEMSQSTDLNFVSKSQPVSPARNGDQKPYKSLSPSPRRHRKRQSPSPPHGDNDRSRSRSPHESRRHTSPKAISSPIKLSSSSGVDSQSERSTSPVTHENGIPEQYRHDYLYEQEHRGHRSRHKHRSSHKRDRRVRESSREREHRSSSSRHGHHRHRERERRKEYEREVYAKKRERERDYGREKVKVRRTDSSRYR